MTSKKDPQQISAAAVVKAQREVEAAKAMREYRAEETAIRVNTLRLRAERLARDAKTAQAASTPKTAKAAGRSAAQ